jgi:hypothetical protein
MGRTWSAVHEERRASASNLAGLGPPDWLTPSLCEAWTVDEVLAHMAATAKKTPSKFVGWPLLAFVSTQ